MSNQVVSLTKLEKASQLLAEISTVDDAKKLVNLAEAARVYAREAELGLEAQNHAAEIKLRAQRRAGEILDEMDKRDGGDAMRARYHDDTEVPPRLEDIGISKADASRWQQIAELPPQAFENFIAATKSEEKELTTAAVLKLAKETRRQDTRKQAIERGAVAHKQTERYQLIHASIAEVEIAPNSIDVIITDPPYPAEYLPLYETLAEKAADWLKPGGSLVVMVGQSYLPSIVATLGRHLSYQWTAAYLTPGGQSAQLWERKVNTFWKPLLWYVKGEYAGKWIGDVIKSDANDKRFHAWGQSESGMDEIVERFSEYADVILDPFCGAGTTGVAAIHLGRWFIGSDVSDESIALAAGRLAQVG